MLHLPVHCPTDFDAAFAAFAAFAAMQSRQADGLLVLVHAFFVLHRVRLAELAARYRQPTMFGFREFVDALGLMSYGPSVPDIARHAADYVHKILMGIRPADLPVEQPTRFELVINLGVARALGLGMPQLLLLRAEQIGE
ncbi:ABC transporter substrate binding protein [Piscinibacter sp.]|uniref:ABC transporter substrate binding protein n=1 Tax=Piscinibacter sp. TaxID=1903157 RepID=UPI002C2AB794|nr:ABC transporter substrate binding protein [Albitalea sp.]HUG23995.1 ABC transporter substrate binding protein [Albitalea sp.]